jgi:hypothetical protein
MASRSVAGMRRSAPRKAGEAHRLGIGDLALLIAKAPADMPSSWTSS